MKHLLSWAILAGIAALLPHGTAAAAAKDKAASAQVREACKADIAAAHPPGSLSRKRSPRETLIAECVQRRAGAAR